MKSKTAARSKGKAILQKEKVDLASFPLIPVTTAARNGEFSAEFNKYIVVYSNNVGGNQQSVWRAGDSCIACYKDNLFVGVISFYENHETMNGGYIDANGVIVIEYPIARFNEIMLTLRRFSNLYLLIVERDSQGTPLAHRVGAIMTFQKKPIGNA